MAALPSWADALSAKPVVLSASPGRPEAVAFAIAMPQVLYLLAALDAGKAAAIAALQGGQPAGAHWEVRAPAAFIVSVSIAGVGL